MFYETKSIPLFLRFFRVQKKDTSNNQFIQQIKLGYCILKSALFSLSTRVNY